VHQQFSWRCIAWLTKGLAVIVVVENGDGLPDANSYIGDIFLLEYFNEARIIRWSELEDPDKDTLLVAASQFIDLSFAWLGRKKTHTQGLNWPRADVCWANTKIPVDGVPPAVLKASAEAVWILLEQDAVNGSLFPAEGDAQVKKEQLGSLSQEYFEKKTEGSDGVTPYAILNQLLQGLYRKTQPGGVVEGRVLRS
jgi:hypothetical protein